MASFLQIFILNNLQFSGYINPYYYIIFILSIPKKTNESIILILSCLLGFVVDVFSNTHGAHAIASLLIGYLKILWTSNKGVIEFEDNVKSNNKSIQQFIIFSLPLIITHHFTIFFLERFSFQEILPVIQLTITSTFFTLILVTIHKIFIPE